MQTTLAKKKKSMAVNDTQLFHNEFKPHNAPKYERYKCARIEGLHVTQQSCFLE